MKKENLKKIVLVGLVAVLSHAGIVQAEKSDAELKAQAKISEEQATKIALQKVPKGKVQDKGLEEENGKLVWSFDLTMPGTKDITEVQVDAKTGEVVEVKTETPKDEAKEKAEDKEKSGKDKDEDDEKK